MARIEQEFQAIMARAVMLPQDANGDFVISGLASFCTPLAFHASRNLQTDLRGRHRNRLQAGDEES
jgi:hypothetical protein